VAASWDPPPSAAPPPPGSLVGSPPPLPSPLLPYSTVLYTVVHRQGGSRFYQMMESHQLHHRTYCCTTVLQHSCMGQSARATYLPVRATYTAVAQTLPAVAQTHGIRLAV
jgi:hypothetical protein